jgi:hypothetical protein
MKQEKEKMHSSRNCRRKAVEIKSRVLNQARNVIYRINCMQCRKNSNLTSARRHHPQN